MVESGRRRGQGGPEITRATGPTVHRESPRLATPAALVLLCDFIVATSSDQGFLVEAKRLRAKLCGLWPELAKDDVEVFHAAEEFDGIPIEDEDV